MTRGPSLWMTAAELAQAAQIRLPSLRVNAQRVQMGCPQEPQTKAARRLGCSAHMPSAAAAGSGPAESGEDDGIGCREKKFRKTLRAPADVSDRCSTEGDQPQQQ